MEIKAKMAVTRHTKGTIFLEQVDWEGDEILNRDDGRVTIPSMYVPKHNFKDIPQVGETCTVVMVF